MKVLVVGGGAAGMMAAISAAECGHDVTLIEKNEKLGKKLFITGKGRCNFTNACDIEDLFSNVITNRKFLYSSFYGFDNRHVMDFFENHGMPYKIERGDRAFPVSDHSSDVIKTLSDYLKLLEVKILLHTKLLSVEMNENTVTGINTNRGYMEADAVILALGGKSYPSCGADGDTWLIAKQLQIDAKDAEPSLVPLTVKESYIQELQGLSLKNVAISLFCNEKLRYSGMGEMLFTHFGLSGPLILSSSCYLKQSDYQNQSVKVVIDLKPALDEKQLSDRLLRDFGELQNKQFKNSLNKLLPAKLIPIIVRESQIPEDKPVHSVTREERLRLVHLLKNLTFTINGNRGFSEAIITRGGINVHEIDPKTMRIKKYNGLYVAGEMIDVDALTGGFNLQIAFSTGHLSGESI